MRHVSTEIVQLPAAELDPRADRAVETGQIRDVTRGVIVAGRFVALKDGEKAPKGTVEVRVGRTKGKTYRRYPAVPGMKRRDHRRAA